MTFTTVTFLLFFLVVFSFYWVLGTARRQNLFLIVASYFFYGWWDPRFCLLMLFSTMVDFWAGARVESAETGGKRKLWLGVSLVSNLGLLGYFKYYDFFYDSLREAASSIGLRLEPSTLFIVLPVGISFYTFQSMSYTLDIYRGRLKATRDPVLFVAFVSFFPQLVAGPIERARDLLPQFTSRRTFDEEKARLGCRYILWGAFQKLAIADNMALFVDPIYGAHEKAFGVALLFATVCFSLQIYADFSGYSCIAIGLANLLGVKLSRNFAYPYFSQSVGEFWRRWHISLSSWFRDYVYIALGGSRVGKNRMIFNLMVTFLLSGLWHGANWTFIVWGAVNGLALLPDAVRGSKKSGRGGAPFENGLSLMGLLRMVATYLIICLSWVFFRARSVSEAGAILESILTGVWSLTDWQNLVTVLWNSGSCAFPLLLALGMLIWEWIKRREELPLTFNGIPRGWRWTIYTALLWVTIIWTQRSGQFIYFQF